MNVIKRFLNVLSVFSVTIALFGLSDVINEHQKARVDREAKCDLLSSLEKVKDGTDPKPFWKYLPDSDGKTVDVVISETKAECDRRIALIQPYGTGRTLLGTSAGFALFVAVLNYILFGKTTLWNRQ